MRSAATATRSLASTKEMSRPEVSGAKPSASTRISTDAGSVKRAIAMMRSWLDPGFAQRRRLRRSARATSDRGPATGSGMGEDVDLGPAGEIQLGARGEEVEAGLRDLHPALADQPRVELLLHLMEEADVGSGII